MDLAGIYRKREENIRTRDIDFLPDGVETGFIAANDRRVTLTVHVPPAMHRRDRARHRLRTFGHNPVHPPVIMSAITMPIPA
ncbi:MAG: hypothetical protein JRJ60_09805 [Deltaproteobacteria bacterium]|nr:hypothetical protein [Deltaproteobacteria bacterium]